jgi:hypothetical protein
VRREERSRAGREVPRLWRQTLRYSGRQTTAWPFRSAAS